MEKSVLRMSSAAFAATLLVALSAISATPATADMVPTAPPTISNDAYKVALEQYKHDREIYIAAINNRQDKIRDINMVFKNSVDKANLDARSALTIANTPLQKSTASANRRNAIDLAINTRDIAISALGPIPTPPVEPVRPEKKAQNGGPGGKSRR